MRYDVASKVVEYGNEAILRRFLGIDPQEVELIEELPQETAGLRRSDYPLRVKVSGVERIILLEFQTRWSWDLPLRLLEYYARFKMRYRLPVMGVVMIESPAYDIIKEEGIKEGIQQGMLEEAREMVLEVLSVKFGVLPLELIRQIKQLLRAAVMAEDLDQFRQELEKVKE